MDSVIIGSNVMVFTNIEVNDATDFRGIKKGTYGVDCITSSKKHFSAEIEIPARGGGKRSLQIDGLGTFVVLEE